MKNYTVRELKAMVKEAQITAVMEMVELMENTGEMLTAAEITRRLNNMSQQQVVAILNTIRTERRFHWSGRKTAEHLQAIAGKVVETGSRRTVRRFAEIDENGDNLENGKIIVVEKETTTYRFKK